MLSGKRAFNGDWAADTRSAILKEGPPDLTMTKQNISPGLERIVRHCLEKNPEQRFHSAHDLAFDLAALSGLSAPGRPAAADSAFSGAGRRRLLLAGAAALALLAVAGAYVVGRRARKETAASGKTAYSQLTFRHAPIFNARFAPDGKTVFYSAAPSGNTPEILSLRPDYPGASPRSLRGIGLLPISWRGEMAVLTKARFIRHDVFSGTLARMPLEGGAPREILAGVREADWSPDGMDLAIVHDVNGRDRLEFPPGKVLCETGGYFSNPRFSRKGDRIAFFEHPIKFDDRGLVGVVDLSGKKTVLSDGYWGLEGLAWSSNGEEVLYSGGAAYSNFTIYAVTLAGRRRVALQSAGGLTIQDVAADGRWIASRDDHYRELAVLAPGQDRERDLSWLDLSYPASLSPDGKILLFTEENDSMGPNYSACLRQTDGSPVVRLGEGTASDLSRDGSWALAAIPSRPQQLVLYPTGAGQPRKLERGGLVSYESAQLFPDGRSILTRGHEEGHGVRCYVQSVDGGKPRPVTPDGTYDGLVSPDGRWYLVSARTGRLLLFPAGGGDPRPVPCAAPQDVVVRWTAD